MRRLALTLLALALAATAGAGRPQRRGGPSGVAAHPAPGNADTAAALVFDVSFILGAGDIGPRGCSPGAPELPKRTFQIGFSATDGPATVSFALAGFTSPTRLASSTKAITLQNGAATVDGLDAGADNNGFTLNHARLTLSAAHAGGPIDTLKVTGAILRQRTLLGDVIFNCDFATTGTGVLDTTPPKVMLPSRCDNGPCLRLADSAVTIWFSELVRTEAAAALVTVTDGDGNPAPFTAKDKGGFALSLTGAWPLGGTIAVRVAPGVQDRAGNAATDGAGATFPIVADPGLLTNAGFESGDLSGFTGNVYRDYAAQSPDGDEFGLLVAQSSATLSSQAQVISGYDGVQPSEGAYMLRLGTGGGCAAGEIALTSRVVIPAGATALTLDFNRITQGSLGVSGGSRLIAATLRSADGAIAAPRPRLTDGTPTDLADGRQSGGWRQFSLPVNDFGGQEVVLILHLRPDYVVGPPPLCAPAVLLVDNLVFA